MFTENLNDSLFYANIAGITSGGASLVRNLGKAYKMQSLYNFNVGLRDASWTSSTRKINARLVGIDPRRLEGSHLIPQRVVKKMVEKAPLPLKRPIELFCNGPLCIQFMKDTEHALVDPKRWNFLPLAQKEVLKTTNPLMANLMDNFPKVGGLVGIYPNTSPLMRPVVNSVVITGGRVMKLENSSRR